MNSAKELFPEAMLDVLHVSNFYRKIVAKNPTKTPESCSYSLSINNSRGSPCWFVAQIFEKSPDSREMK